jgi:Ala-tRNA(Pro) deacylase
MSVPNRILQFLKDNQVAYESHRHPTAYTAQEVAAAEHVPGRELAKTVMVRAEGRLVMVVLPAPYRVDLHALRGCLKAGEVRLAQEQEFAGQFPGVEPGAMPPFGNLWEIPVYVDRTLEQDEKITFNAGTHQDSLTVAYADFKRLVQPQVIDCAVLAGAKNA